MTVLTAQAWGSNGALIADVAKLGYLNGRVLDLTWGSGAFWNVWRPADLTACTNDERSPIGYPVDFRKLPFRDGTYDTVVLDPPYKLNGTSQDDVQDRRYGVHVPATWRERHELMRDGLVEAMRVSRHLVLFKCQDQVVSGRKRWQTMIFARVAYDYGAELLDRFDLLRPPRAQPSGRREVHSLSNYSTLLVFEVPRRRR